MQAVESRLLSGVKHVNELGPLTLELAEHATPPRRRLALLHTLRRVYTAYWHAGRMHPPRVPPPTAASAAARSAGGKRARVDGDAAAAAAGGALVARWLRTQFYNYLETLVSVLATQQDALPPARGGAAAADSASSSEGAPVDHTAVQVAAMRTIGHFVAHASSSAQQDAEGGLRLSFDVLQWLLRHVLSADPVGAADPGRDAPGGGLAPRASRSLWNALRAFRSEFVDEYDDVRLALLKAVAAVVASKSRQAAVAAARTAPVVDDGDSAADAASRAALAAAPAATVLRAAVDLLLSISLPLTDAEWRAAPHALWARHEWEAVLPAGTYAALEGSGGGDGDGDGPGSASDSDDDDVAPTAASGIAAAGKHGGAAALLLHEQRSAYAAAWLAVLGAPGVPPDLSRRVLLALPTAVLPHMPGRTPLLLADYLTSCVDAGVGGARGGDDAGGGVVALLALQSLFILMQRHGLEYPRFYGAVYSLLRPSVVAAKHRARFFKCLDHFLASAAVPAYTAAAFAKRAARLALTAPTPFALFALPFIANLVKRHAAITPLIHRAAAPAPGSSGAAAWPGAADPFDALADDPAASRALESSLWELVALSNHAFAPVCHLARGLTRDIARAEADVTDAAVSGATFAALITGELERSVKRGGETAPADAPFAFQRRAGGSLLSRGQGGSAVAAGDDDGGGSGAAAMDACIDFFA